jgi:hypothetical protein
MGKINFRRDGIALLWLIPRLLWGLLLCLDLLRIILATKFFIIVFVWRLASHEAIALCRLTYPVVSKLQGFVNLVIHVIHWIIKLVVSLMPFLSSILPDWPVFDLKELLSNCAGQEVCPNHNTVLDMALTFPRELASWAVCPVWRVTANTWLYYALYPIFYVFSVDAHPDGNNCKTSDQIFCFILLGWKLLFVMAFVLLFENAKKPALKAVWTIVRFLLDSVAFIVYKIYNLIRIIHRPLIKIRNNLNTPSITLN